MHTLTIDPITRIEGHPRVRVTMEEGKISQAQCSGALFRGVELILLRRRPWDAQRMAARICGVCPIAHATAAAFALAQASGVEESIQKWATFAQSDLRC